MFDGRCSARGRRWGRAALAWASRRGDRRPRERARTFHPWRASVTTRTRQRQPARAGVHGRQAAGHRSGVTAGLRTGLPKMAPARSGKVRSPDHQRAIMDVSRNSSRASSLRSWASPTLERNPSDAWAIHVEGSVPTQGASFGPWLHNARAAASAAAVSISRRSPPFSS